MKKLVSFLLMAAVAAVVVSCGGKSTPEDTVKNFFKALQNDDYDGASSYADASTKEVLKTLKGMHEMQQMGGKKSEKKGDIKDVKCTTTETSGTCDVCCNAAGNPSKVKLVNEGGKWLVSMTKEELTNKETPNLGGGDNTGAPVDTTSTTTTTETHTTGH